MSRFPLVLTALVLAAAPVLVPVLSPALAQDTASKSFTGIPTTTDIWAGIYTEEQAGRGQVDYLGCVECHQPQLEGDPSEGVPALAAPSFMVEWDGQTVADLVRHIHAAPNDNPDDIDPATAADLTAFILHQNGVPSGKTELSTDRTQQAKILFTERKPN